MNRSLRWSWVSALSCVMACMPADPPRAEGRPEKGSVEVVEEREQPQAGGSPSDARQQILERAARSHEGALRGLEITDQAKNACVVQADAQAAQFIRDGRLNLEAWLAVASEDAKLQAIACITEGREALRKAASADFERCRPVLERIAGGMDNEDAMAYAMRNGCERYIMP